MCSFGQGQMFPVLDVTFQVADNVIVSVLASGFVEFGTGHFEFVQRICHHAPLVCIRYNRYQFPATIDPVFAVCFPVEFRHLVEPF